MAIFTWIYLDLPGFSYIYLLSLVGRACTTNEGNGGFVFWFVSVCFWFAFGLGEVDLG
jgi:hypothetical protein